MSFQAMTWATEQELPAMQKIVLLMMANRTSHDTGLCFPSHDLLAKECGMTKRSLINQIAMLEAAGLVEVIRSSNDSGMKNVNRYRLMLHVKAESQEKTKASEIGSAGDSLGSEGDSLGGSERDAHKPVTLEPISTTTTGEKTGAAKKQKIAADWQPSDRCVELIARAGIPQAFADRLVDEFVLYWQERGEKRHGWEATFLNHVKSQFEKQQGRAVGVKKAGMGKQSISGENNVNSDAASQSFAEKYAHLKVVRS
ncbi:MAG: DnaT-like ssDNA-binding domain-containing protein [Methylobacter sp.]